MPEPRYTYAATIRRVIDGDTYELDVDLGLRVHLHARIRLDGVDCPEQSTPQGVAATEHARGLLPEGARVVVATAKPDKYGRTLASVWVAGHNVAQALIEAGHARPYAGGSRA